MKKTLIERIELASSAATVTFSSIPQSFTDLYILIAARTTRTNVTVDNVLLSINGQGASANISNRYLGGDGSSAFASNNGSDAGLANGANVTAGAYSNNSVYIPNYTKTQYKSMSVDGVMENYAGYSVHVLAGTRWNQTAAITSITLDGANGDLVSGSSFALYGVTAGSDGTTTVS